MGKKNGISDNWSLFRKPQLAFKKRMRKAHRLFKGFPVINYDCIVDIGANTGSFTDDALAYFRPKRVCLVEADPEFARGLRQKYASNPACTIVEAAITNRSGVVTFRINSHKDSSSILPINPISSLAFGMDMRELKGISVSALSLNDLFERESITDAALMKVDIQGAEKLLIEGGRNALRKTRCIYMEVVFEEFYKGCAQFDELHALLRGEGFKLRSFHKSRIGSDGAMAYSNGLFINRRFFQNTHEKRHPNK